MKKLKIILTIFVLIFAIVGFLFTSVFIAMQFGWLNVRGSIESRNNSIMPTDTLIGSDPSDTSCLDTATTCRWFDTREWEVVAGGLVKDKLLIERVATETGVSSRLISAVVVPEQIRFFTSNREVFKRYFEPLKILGSLSAFSLGVSGIKQDTAKKIEEHALNPNSEFYPGDSYAELLKYESGINQDEELFNRLTNEKDHYFSYLYTAVFIKEILEQWKKAGYDISNQPQIVSTIFNIGFSKSKPNSNPQVGGTKITVGGIDYTFGELSGLFYQSEKIPEINR